MSLTPTTVPEPQLDCRLPLFTEEEGGGGGGWWDSWWLAPDHRLCAYKTLRAKQAVPGSSVSPLLREQRVAVPEFTTREGGNIEVEN